MLEFLHLILGISSESETIESSRLKQVRCERCGGDFVYTLTRMAKGSATVLFHDHRAGAEKAGKIAYDAIKFRLDNEMDLSACPLCGHFQSEMVRRKKVACTKSTALSSAAAGFAALPIMLLVLGLERASEAAVSEALLALATGTVVLTLCAPLLVWFNFDPNRERLFPYPRRWLVPGTELGEHQAQIKARNEKAQQELAQLGKEQARALEVAEAKQAVAREQREAERKQMADRAMKSIMGKKR